MIRISKILKIPVDIDIKNEVMDPAKRMELKILELFQLSLSWHYKKFSEIKSLPILQAVLH